MVNAPRKNVCSLAAGKYRKSMKNSTRQHHQANEAKSGLEAESVRALGALRSLRSKMKLSAENGGEMHFLRNTEQEKWIEDYVDRETTVARKQVQDAETAIMQEQEHIRNVEKAWSTTTEHETTFEEMLNAIGDSLSDLASSEDEEDGEDDDDDEEDTELGKLGEDNEHGWVMGTISKMEQHHMESFRQKQMRLNDLTQPGWRDAASYFRERDMQYGTTELKVPAVVKPQTEMTAATPSPTTFGQLMQVLDIVPLQSQMLQVRSPQGSSQIRLGSEKPQADNHILSLMPNVLPDSSQRQIATPVQPVSIYPSILRRTLITI